MRDKNIRKALELLEQFEQNEHNKTDDVHWVEDSNGNSDWGDFCGDCVDGVLKTVRKEYLQKQRKLPISERDEEFEKFETRYNYGGGYEDDSFKFCNECGKRLDISVLPGDDDLDNCIEQLKNGDKIDNSLGYECYWLLYNNWGNDNKDKWKNKLYGKTLELANRVISALAEKEALAEKNYVV